MPLLNIRLIAIVLLYDLGDWGWADLWDSMGVFARCLMILLALMLSHTVILFSGRQVRYARARSYSRAFVRDIAPPLTRHDPVEAIRVARMFPESHIATVVFSGLADFISRPSHYTEPDVMETTKSALQRSRSLVHAELKRGLGTLALITSTAPFIGLLGTVIGIFESLREWGTQKAYVFGWTNQAIAESLAPTGISLAVAILAAWTHNYLVERLEIFDIEMMNASSELESYLHAHRRLSERPYAVHTISGSLFAEDENGKPGWEVECDSQGVLLISFLALAAYSVFLFASAMSRSLR